ncbi:MAG TPA: hypothetical protein VLS25_00330 [Dehalococcoidia bacterium]|nr:hypothetical protein [Dehalococcoidia bacterium]
MSAFDQIRDVYFGSARAPMRLSPEARRRVLWTSVAPAVVVLAVLIRTALSILYDAGELFDYGGEIGHGSAPFLVRRLYTVSTVLRTLQFVALALLFATGLQRWTRAEGSWMILIGTALAVIAVVCGAFVVGVYAVHGRADDGLRTELWIEMASDFALMAVGYFFLAYRGASAPDEPDEMSAANST